VNKLQTVLGTVPGKFRCGFTYLVQYSTNYEQKDSQNGRL